MKFNDFITGYSIAKRLGVRTTTVDEFYNKIIASGIRNGNFIEATEFEVERRWIKARRPYYNVFPSIIPSLLRLKLDFDSGSVECPLDVILVRLPTEHNPLFFQFDGKTYFVKTLMMNRSVVREERGISVWIDIGEIVHGSPVYTFQNIQCIEGQTIEESLLNLPKHPSAGLGVIVPNEVIQSCVRFAVTLCLLENDPEVVEPDVLADDQQRFLETLDKKYVEKAHRRGKIGWNIGRKIEVSPHVRGPSPAALYWTGKGRLIPKIRFRRGCIVHRRTIEKFPTGFLDDEKPLDSDKE